MVRPLMPIPAYSLSLVDSASLIELIGLRGVLTPAYSPPKPRHIPVRQPNLSLWRTGANTCLQPNLTT